MANTLDDGDEAEVQGSSSTYTLKRLGDVYSCSCPAWRNQSTTIDKRTCKHLRAYLGDAVETARIGAPMAARGTPAPSAKSSSGGDDGKAPPILLAHKWEAHQDPTGWWMSEKLDGIRAYWDGEAFVSRLGNKFFAPDWFIADLPADTLDGELWVGRKQFQRTTSIVRSGSAAAEWRSVTYVVFDAPNAKGTFEARLAHAQKVLERANAPHARWHPHMKCDGLDHLRDELARVEALGGEGLMLRQPGSAYHVGRSSTLLKVKTFHDAEARVIGHAPGTGKHKGRLGALIVELADGTKFNVGTGFSDAERESPPKIGSVITFRYQELSNDGVPRFPSYVGERIDAKVPAPPKQAAPTPAAAKPAKKSAPPPPPAADDDDDDDGPVKLATGAADFHVRLVHETENKFWEIEVRGGQHVTKFGKLGTAGQMRLTDIGSSTAARTDAEKRAAQKRKEGYKLVKS
jgi:DNA ligase